MFYIAVNQYKISYHYSLTDFSLKISFFGVFGLFFTENDVSLFKQSIAILSCMV